MAIIWDPAKQRKLKAERGIDLDEIRVLLEERRFLEILEHRSRKDQILFVLVYKSYVHVVPVKMENDRMIIKTCFPSRKFHRKWEDKT